ncbi:MAG: hypothetical protein WKF80_13070 [Thermomicrobiales bacterium]
MAVNSVDPLIDQEWTHGTNEIGGGPAARVGQVIDQLQADSARMVANWVLQVANMPAFRAWPDLSLTKLQESIPALLGATLLAMRSPDPSRDPEPQARAIEVAERHGRARADDAFPIGVLLAEFQAMRAELRLAILRIADAEPGMVEVARELEGRLTQTLDAAIIAAAEGWVDRTASEAR